MCSRRQSKALRRHVTVLPLSAQGVEVLTRPMERLMVCKRTRMMGVTSQSRPQRITKVGFSKRPPPSPALDAG
jgi:hypothetical protein